MSEFENFFKNWSLEYSDGYYYLTKTIEEKDEYAWLIFVSGTIHELRFENLDFKALSGKIKYELIESANSEFNKQKSKAENRARRVAKKELEHLLNV